MNPGGAIKMVGRVDAKGFGVPFMLWMMNTMVMVRAEIASVEMRTAGIFGLIFISNE
jgi:hypothetical protein